MLETIIMTFKLTRRQWRRLWHMLRMLHSQGIVKIPFRRDWWFWYYLVLNLLECLPIIILV